MRRTRQKANLHSTPSLILSQPAWELERSNGSKMKASKAIVENGETRMHNSGYAFVPIKATQMASKILEHLERTPSSSRLAGTTEKSATKMTSNLALGILDKVKSSKFLLSSHNNQKSEGHHHSEENAPVQGNAPTTNAASTLALPAEPPQKKPAFRMSAPERGFSFKHMRRNRYEKEMGLLM
nr:hypothetical protein [Tanacetum cinerariifolium]